MAGKSERIPRNREERVVENPTKARQNQCFRVKNRVSGECFSCFGFEHPLWKCNNTRFPEKRLSPVQCSKGPVPAGVFCGVFSGGIAGVLLTQAVLFKPFAFK